MSRLDKSKVVAVITRDEELLTSKKEYVLEMLKRVPLNGAIRTSDKSVVNAFRNLTYEWRKKDPTYRRCIVKSVDENGRPCWILYRDVRAIGARSRGGNFS